MLRGTVRALASRLAVCVRRGDLRHLRTLRTLSKLRAWSRRRSNRRAPLVGLAAAAARIRPMRLGGSTACLQLLQMLSLLPTLRAWGWRGRVGVVPLREECESLLLQPSIEVQFCQMAAVTAAIARAVRGPRTPPRRGPVPPLPQSPAAAQNCSVAALEIVLAPKYSPLCTIRQCSGCVCVWILHRICVHRRDGQGCDNSLGSHLAYAAQTALAQSEFNGPEEIRAFLFPLTGRPGQAPTLCMILHTVRYALNRECASACPLRPRVDLVSWMRDNSLSALEKVCLSLLDTTLHDP